MRSAPRLAGRDLGVDALRGVALLSMFVAHCAPVDGPFQVFLLSEYLTYPLFATLVGMGAALAREHGFRSALVRGAFLVAVGLLLEQSGALIIVVLVYLGLLTWVVHPLARQGTPLVGAVGLVAFLAAPRVHAALFSTRVSLQVHGHDLAARLLDYTATGDDYSFLAMVAFASLGVVLVRAMRPGALLSAPSRLLVVGIMIGVVAMAYGAAAHTGVIDMAPYDGGLREHLFCVLLVTAVSSVVLGLTPYAVRLAQPLAAMGRMSLTLYSLQVLYLAWYVRVLHPGQGDDRWSNVALLAVGSLLVAVVWGLVVRRGRFRRGPLEGVTALLVRAHLGPRKAGPVPV